MGKFGRSEECEEGAMRMRYQATSDRAVVDESRGIGEGDDGLGRVGVRRNSCSTTSNIIMPLDLTASG